MDSAGAKSTLSNAMQELTQGKEQTTNTIRGHKANISNPNTSAASKENSQQVIDFLGGSDTQEAIRANPVSKEAAQSLEGTRAAAA